MSQNRGYRRDGRPNYQMNSYGGRSGSQMNVNPWQGGMVPGGVRSGVAGLLPTPPQTSNLISQLSSPETQLALASNLLSTLLGPQQQQSQVPSLLSLGALGQVGGVGSYRQGGYDQGRFGDRGQNRRRLEQRRSDYGKGRPIASSKGGSERKSGGAGYRSPNIGKRPASGSKVGSKGDKKDDAQKDKDEDKANNEEDVKREDGEEDEEKKRDWKDEKKHDDDDDDDSDQKGTDKGRKSRYHGIPDHLFFCHVCKKHMWDDQSFENHLKGRTHQLMMDKLDESYRIKVELMRHELKVAEQQREIEMERIKRRGRKVHMTRREYCTMCDLHLYGSIVVHRKNKRHQQLKSFLHPKCGPCGKEFASHIEWDHHKLTPVHLRKTAESLKNRETESDDEFGIEDLIALGDEDMFTKNEMKVRTKEEEKEDIRPAEKTDKDEDKDEEMKDEEVKEDGKEDSEKPEIKTEEGATVDDPTSINSENFKIPKYNPDVPYATNLVKKITGFHCRACRRFYINEEDSQMHCRTMTHYNNTVTLLKIKLQKIAAKQQREIRKDGEKSKRNADEKVDDEGNWKRRKVSEEKDEDDEATHASDGSKGDEEMKDLSENDKKSDAADKYDPMEADAEAEAAEKKGPSSDSPTKGKSEEEKMWSEVDKEIGSILEAVDEENDDTEIGDSEDQHRQEQEAKDEKSSPRATRGSVSVSGTAARGSSARGRGRKRK